MSNTKLLFVRYNCFPLSDLKNSYPYGLSRSQIWIANVIEFFLLLLAGWFCVCLFAYLIFFFNLRIQNFT